MTIKDERPECVEAIVVDKGKIAHVCIKADIFGHKKDNTKLIDLKSKALIPGFIDKHITQYADALERAELSPPPHW